MHRKMLFIINPKAGKKRGESLIPIIHKKLLGKISFEIKLWNKLDELSNLINKLKKEGFTDAVAVGGDGTVNLIAQHLVNSTILFGIIPTGSGNGLARSLDIPMDPEDAINTLFKNNIRSIDSGTINNSPFFCTSGLGFDAHIGHLFATSVKRGLISYIKIISKEFRKYKSISYKLKVDGVDIDREAFLITIANAGQYGNNFYIAPQAKMTDGKFNLVILRSFNFLEVFGLLYYILSRRADRSSLIESFECTNIIIERSQADYIHFDGEPKKEGEIIEVKILPLSIRVLTGDNFMD
ncbi:MAG: diacylglycerol kinase family lipid kinase [Sphingobacteriaceae bacterium]|nr:diacylglycerol kinase family lipid kinase [Sphingobacteriaceae bacterium]